MAAMLILLGIIYSIALAHGQRACYVGPGLEYRAPSYVVPCVEDGESACCMLGDTCLSGSVCWNYDVGNLYQYGCTDSTYSDSSCPYKCGWNASKYHRPLAQVRCLQSPALSPWVDVEYCDGVAGVNDTWVCHAPESCGCQWPGQLNPLLLPHPRACHNMGSDARVALFAPSTLAPYVSLPSVYGGSTGYYSPTIRSDVSTWESTAISNCEYIAVE